MALQRLLQHEGARMDLILWRHAEAEELGEGMDDLTRALTPRGEKQAAKVAAWLGSAVAMICLIPILF